ncbi:unnamed protein product, partial [Rotaria sp. Silwood2]
TEQMLTEEQKSLERSVQTLTNQKNQLEILLHRHLYSNNNNGNNKCVTINFTNAQDLLALAPLTRITTADGSSSSSSSVLMIAIHIIPEVAQALLGSTSIDKAKLAELLQQVNVNNSSSTRTI